MKHRQDLAIASMLGIAIAGSLGFMAAYIVHATIQIEGLALAIALTGFVAAALAWSSWIIGRDQVVDQIDEYPSVDADRDAARAELDQAQTDVSRNGALIKLLVAALAVFGIAALFPFRSWGPAPGKSLFSTKWKRGSRLVREDGELVTRDALNLNSSVTVFPEGAIGDAASQTVLIRLPQGVGASVDGYVAYSKVCTHAGCPVALYRAATRQMMCPCHQSIFDATDAGKVISGPADHALPQLPLEIDPHGYLRATGDYPVPIGPGFWERA
ncbi:MAG: Rieske 2Fe-2S domain-containing protein [Vulcanimicrobiaceae bacterium]|jgi:ubiquinol-cytochrome c reductase iron-sulfur subunit